MHVLVLSPQPCGLKQPHGHRPQLGTQAKLARCWTALDFNTEQKFCTTALILTLLKIWLDFSRGRMVWRGTPLISTNPIIPLETSGNYFPQGTPTIPLPLKTIPYFTIGKLYFVKMLISPKIINRFNVIPITIYRDIITFVDVVLSLGEAKFNNKILKLL